MTENIDKMLHYLNSKEYKKLRNDVGDIRFKNPSDIEDGIEIFKKITELDTPVIFEHDDFGFNRSTNLSGTSGNGNITPNYYRVISTGFDGIKEQIENNIAKETDQCKIAYGKAMLKYIDLCLEIADKYKTLAKEQGKEKLYNALLNVPHKGATTFYEACVFLKMCIYFIRCSLVEHIGLGRFDQYMYPFYLNDKKNGISDEEIAETIASFFISLNFDTDLYTGIQQGDNGQSMVLGGFDKDGNSMYNELSQMCMQASLELNLIDPKINLRVGKNTPDEIYEFATLLTKQGLGFPQYCNDDIVVPGLVKLGYDYEDALDYVVAACWEFIIPGKGVDIPNTQIIDFPDIANRVIMSKLDECDTFDSLMNLVKNEIAADCDVIVESRLNFELQPRPLCSIFMDGCIESLTDMWQGGTKYKNYGSHGAGIANAADALAAVKKNIYDEKTITKAELIEALKNDFEGYTEVRNILRNSPKMGNNEDYVDDIACEIMKAFSKNLNNRDNGSGGVWRAGTGSAMEYLHRGKKCPATADGRKAGQPYSSSYSPSMDVKTTGLLSVIQSFTKYDLSDIINGGPLTIEIHDTVLRNDVGVTKTAMLVKNFILLGGHQLQLNSINKERLLDAQKHPENYPNLIVRVWGWSGYFNELDVEYQNHIVRRVEYIG